MSWDKNPTMYFRKKYKGSRNFLYAIYLLTIFCLLSYCLPDLGIFRNSDRIAFLWNPQCNQHCFYTRNLCISMFQESKMIFYKRDLSPIYVSNILTAFLFCINHKFVFFTMSSRRGLMSWTWHFQCPSICVSFLYFTFLLF